MYKTQKILPQSFYQRDNVLQIARELLGKTLVTHVNNETCRGTIVEVEAYNGRTDKACHAYGGRRTKRTETMYLSGGIAYVYLCYGIHHLFNVVTNAEDMADAILIRALEPIEGLDVMKKRLKSKNQKLTNGPGVLSKAMGIEKSMNQISLEGNHAWIEDAPMVSDDQMVACPRIGIDYAEEDALLPWRFYVKENNWVSKT